MHELTCPLQLLHAAGRRTRPGRLCAATAALVVLAAACSRPAPQSPWSEARLAHMTVRQKAMQLLLVRPPATGLRGVAGDSARARFRRWTAEGVGGVEMAPGDARAVRA
ncbi:MAG: hypothetical protein JO306_02855, partial [Gemmatimonadetes bacterium]|nr:hypothetical protein [Gemmatimonadota bacterium]